MVLLQTAVTDRRGGSTLKFKKTNVGETMLMDGGGAAARPGDVIQTVTLDDLLPFVRALTPSRLALKVDTEGHEFQVLAGGPHLFRSLPLVAVLTEWLFHARGPTAGGAALDRFVSQEGYAPHGGDLVAFFAKKGFAPFHAQTGTPLHGNYTSWPSNVLWKKLEHVAE